ncbi:MAG: hypothetical protein J6V44_09615 [Methanobrevibacter sp.]|nr:hypothetical protein [Methanobrevibacter sp.]
MNIYIDKATARKFGLIIRSFICRNGGNLTKYEDNNNGKLYIWAEFRNKTIRRLFSSYGGFNLLLCGFCKMYTLKNEVRIVIEYDKDAVMHYFD